MFNFREYRTANRFRRLNRTFQILLTLFLIIEVNFIAAHLFGRFDLSEKNQYTLTPETRAHIADLKKPVSIFVTLPKESAQEDQQILYRYVSNLLKEFQFASRSGKTIGIEVDYVDINRDLVRAKELANRFDLTQPYQLIVVCEDRHRVVLPTDILEFKELRPVAFKGEQAIISALLEVINERKTQIYFTVGHGEMRLDDTSPFRGLSQLAGELRSRNFNLTQLEIADKGVPADADLLVIADPVSLFQPIEIEYLRNFLNESAGRLLLLNGPGHESGIESLLRDWGILMDNKVILENGENFQENTGSLLIRQFADMPLTRSLIENQTPVVTGFCRPVRQDPAAPFDERLTIKAIMASSQDSWAESDWESLGVPKFDAQFDIAGPVTLGIYAQRGGRSPLGIQISGGRLIAYGNADFIANKHINIAGNYWLFFNSINSILDRDRLLKIPPKAINNYKLAISQQELRQVNMLLFIPALCAGILGLLVHWLRKH
jgi:ABC-type uncharacterized transport system involved in gliding motility auxiliary subunit